MLTQTRREGLDGEGLDGKAPQALPFLPFLPFPPLLPFPALVRRGSRGRLDREVDVLRLAWADGHALGHRTALLVPRFDRVSARREALDVELAVLVGHRDEPGAQNANIG